jgi:hypothetical protein
MFYREQSAGWAFFDLLIMVFVGLFAYQSGAANARKKIEEEQNRALLEEFLQWKKENK